MGFDAIIKYIHQNSIDGDIVECGVWKGGNIILSSLVCEHSGIERNMWAYDTYTGMSEPVSADVAAIGNNDARIKWKNSEKGTN
ncbi:MAG: hypothetical protein HC903_12170 [Methylacidiphilales bacterium]|nr:hypothetical protein [Candidatus Methylacidiphilales bacterium]